MHEAGNVASSCQLEQAKHVLLLVNVKLSLFGGEPEISYNKLLELATSIETRCPFVGVASQLMGCVSVRVLRRSHKCSRHSSRTPLPPSLKRYKERGSG
jgi:hypothetical protein